VRAKTDESPRVHSCPCPVSGLGGRHRRTGLAPARTGLAPARTRLAPARTGLAPARTRRSLRLLPLTALAVTTLWMGSTATAAATPPAPPPAATPAATPSTTTTPPSTTTTTGSAPADRWIHKAIAAEQNFGSVQVDGTITQGKSEILLDLLVNRDGEGGGEFVQQGNLIKIERVGPLLYFNAPTKFWAGHATAAQTQAFGGKWIEFSAVDPRFTSFDQFLDAADLVVAAFQGHTAPLTLGRPTTFAGHRVVVVKDTVTSGGKNSTGRMYIGAAGPAYVYKIVDDTPGNVSTIVFTHYGKGVTLAVPPNAINLS
jgi:hypothetical protein